MEMLTVNISGLVRRVREKGRDYLVAPVTMIVPGVLNGSLGPLLYPPEECAHNPAAWNGMPIVKGHPAGSDGAALSAHNPVVLARYGMGEVRNAYYDGRLRAEAWFDVLRTRTIDPGTYADLVAGRRIEQSTGLYTKNHPAQNGASHNGRRYVAVARNYRPDHLAILRGGRGACSIEDGCGVNNSLRGVSMTTTNAKRPPLSSKLDMTPDKACKILKDGTVNGHALSPAQRGMFGALCGKRKGPAKNEAGALVRGLTFLGLMANQEEEDDPLELDPSEFTVVDDPVPAPEFHTVTNELSHEQLRSSLDSALKGRYTQADPYCYITDVYDDYFIYNQDGKSYRLGYTVNKDDTVSLDTDATEVVREVSFNPVATDNAAGCHCGGTCDSCTNKGEPGMAGKLNDHQREEIIGRLTGNSGGPANMPWRRKDVPTLRRDSDEMLMAYDEMRAESLKLTGNAGAPAGGYLNPSDGSRGIYNSRTGQWEIIPGPAPTANQQQTPTPAPAPAATPAPAPGTPAVPVAVPVQNQDEFQRWLATMPPAAQAVWNQALGVVNQQKAAMVERLTENMQPEAKAAAQAVYNQMQPNDLQALVNALPQRHADMGPPPTILNMFGALGAPAPTPAATTTEEPLQPPVYNFSKTG